MSKCSQGSSLIQHFLSQLPLLGPWAEHLPGEGCAIPTQGGLQHRGGACHTQGVPSAPDISGYAWDVQVMKMPSFKTFYFFVSRTQITSLKKKKKKVEKSRDVFGARAVWPLQTLSPAALIV